MRCIACDTGERRTLLELHWPCYWQRAIRRWRGYAARKGCARASPKWPGLCRGRPQSDTWTGWTRVPLGTRACFEEGGADSRTEMPSTEAAVRKLKRSKFVKSY